MQFDTAAKCARNVSEINVEFSIDVAHHENCTWECLLHYLT